jgi:hypothetical protein
MSIVENGQLAEEMTERFSPIDLNCPIKPEQMDQCPAARYFKRSTETEEMQGQICYTSYVSETNILTFIHRVTYFIFSLQVVSLFISL